MPMSRTTLDVVSVTGSRCEVSADSPSAAATEVSASSTGTAAASRAPNATTRITSVTGRLSTSAWRKSSPYVFCSAFSIVAPPTCSTRRSGWAAWTAAVASTSGCTRSAASCGSPVISARTSTAVPPGDGIGWDTWATSGRPRSRRPASPAAAVAAAWSSGPDLAVIRTFSTAGSVKWASASIRSARPHSPTACCASVCDAVPAMPPTAMQITTNATQPDTARQRCSALQRAIRTTLLGRLFVTASSFRDGNCGVGVEPVGAGAASQDGDHPSSGWGCPHPDRAASRIGNVGAGPYGGSRTDESGGG